MVVPEEILFQKPSGVDDLLRVLGSNNNKLANLYKKRKREHEGRSDSEEDEDCESGSGLNEGEEIDNDRDVSSEDTEANVTKENAPAEIMMTHENEDAELSDSDIFHNSEDEGQQVGKETRVTSSFQCHLGKIITDEEIGKLTKKKMKFTWELPATDIPLSKWLGTGDPPLKDTNVDSTNDVKRKLCKHWSDIYKDSGPNKFRSSRDRFFTLCNSYRDILHCNKKPFYMKGNEEDSSVMDAYIMHTLNHVYRTRDLVLKNDARVSKHQAGEEEKIFSSGTFLDQGFTRPKVMFLLPLASIAMRVVRRLIELTPVSNKANVEHLSRFHEEFGASEEVEENGEEDVNFKPKKSSKPKDFQSLFGGNNNDHFMLGIKFTRRSIRLYSDFYSSDIIVASPLGLVTKIGETEVDKEKDVDYLSSIEVLIIDHADVIAMQNWSHVNTAVEQLNRTPSKQLGTDIMRVRPWYLDGHAHFYRQTILLGSFVNPDINAFFNKLCLNYEGKVKLISEYKGVLPKILLQVRQVFERFDASSIVDADDARLDFFCKKVYPKIKDSIEGGTMLFISSYFEFVRVRNFLKSQNASFCLLGEYTKQSDISRARVWFYEGKRKIMLYTERAHFYHRYKIRGIQNLIIYSLPKRKEFYPEIINMLDESKNMACSVLFSRYDQLRLERIVGSTAAKRMLSSDKSMFIFC